jgi:plasmid stabilization system protein ParE
VSVVFHRLAREEYRQALRWYARRGAVLAQRFRQAVDQVVQAIAAAPAQGAVFRGPFRWMRTRRFPYVLYYRVLTPNQVMVLAVAHARRRPGYWLRRSP